MRTLSLTNPYMQGEDVKHAQTHLNKYLGSHAPALPVDGHFGNETGQHCRLAKLRLGYPKTKCRRTYGPTLDGYLTSERKPSAAMKQRAATYKKAADSIGAKRKAIVSQAKWGVSHGGSIHYEQLRPIDGIHQVHKLPLRTDCSGFVTLCYKWAGAPDPNGLNYSGYGYTGSLLSHLHGITKGQLLPGDVIVYGDYPGHHTVLYIGGGMVISQGKEDDPHEYTIEAMDEKMYGPTHYLRLPLWH